VATDDALVLVRDELEQAWVWVRGLRDRACDYESCMGDPS
jgi:hypothetical protein